MVNSSIKSQNRIKKNNLLMKKDEILTNIFLRTSIKNEEDDFDG
jgi:hypothetical protein